MIISMSDILCVTNRSLCKEDFLARVEKIAANHPKGIILREKDSSRDYDLIKLWIKLDHFLVSIENELLYEAMLILSKRRLKIILYSYFEDLTDKQIGEIMMIPKSTVHRQRNAALQCMREKIEEEMEAYGYKRFKKE